MRLVETRKSRTALAVVEAVDKVVELPGEQVSVQVRAQVLKKAVPLDHGSFGVDLLVVAGFAEYSVDQVAPSGVVGSPDHTGLWQILLLHSRSNLQCLYSGNLDNHVAESLEGRVSCVDTLAGLPVRFAELDVEIDEVAELACTRPSADMKANKLRVWTYLLVIICMTNSVVAVMLTIDLTWRQCRSS